MTAIEISGLDPITTALDDDIVHVKEDISTEDVKQTVKNFIENNSARSPSFNTTTLAQTTTTGNTLSVTRDLAAGSTDSAVSNFVQDNASDDQYTIYAQQDGTSDCINVKMNGTAGRGIYVEVPNTRDQFSRPFRCQTVDGNESIALLNGRTNVTGSSFFARNLASGDTAGPILAILNQNASDDQESLQITHSGTGDAVYIDNNGTGSSSRALEIDNASNSTAIDISQTGEGKGIFISSSAASATNYAMHISANSGASPFFAQSTNFSVLAAGQTSSSFGSFVVYRNADSGTTNTPLVSITQDNAADDQPALQIQQDADVDVIRIDGTDQGTSFTTIAGSVKVNLNGTTYYMNLYN